MIHTVKGFVIVNKSEVDILLELSCFFDDSSDVGNLISDSSAFSKSSLNIWKLTVQVLLKPGITSVHFLKSFRRWEALSSFLLRGCHPVVNRGITAEETVLLSTREVFLCTYYTRTHSALGKVQCGIQKT